MQNNNDNNDAKEKKEDIQSNLKYILQKITGTEDQTYKFKEKERIENRNMAVLSYIIPPIPFIAERSSAYVRFHANQGMNLLLWYVLVSGFIWVIDQAFPWEYITDFFSLVTNILLVLLVFFGIMNTLKDYAKEVPLVSKINLITFISTILGK